MRNMYRVTATETMIGDQRIGPDQFIVAWIGSANRDEAEFPDPDRFDFLLGRISQKKKESLKRRTP